MTTLDVSATGDAPVTNGSDAGMRPRWGHARIQAPMARETVDDVPVRSAARPRPMEDSDLEDFLRPKAPRTPSPAATVTSVPAVAAVAAAEPRPAPSAVSAEVRRLVQSSVDASEDRARSRFDAMDDRLLKATAQAAEVRSRLVATEQRLTSLERRITALEALPSVVEDLVACHVDRLKSEVAGLPADMEGIYRELDAVAEVMATRTAGISQSLDRLQPLESAVLELRQEFRLAADAAREAHRSASRSHEEQIERLETRLDTLERPGSDLERLHQALGRVISAAGRAAQTDGGRDLFGLGGSSDPGTTEGRFSLGP
jgi:uncharacterized protein YoxC